MKNRRMIVIFAVLFAVLLIVVVLQGRDLSGLPFQRATATPDLIAEMPRVLTDFTVLDIQAIRIGSPNTGQNFLITRTNDGIWTAPETEGNLNTEAATLIARTMVLLPYLESFNLQAGENLADFGFVSENPRAVTVEILLVDGETHALFFGGLTPLQDAFYTVVDDEETIYLVPPQAVEFLRLQLRNPPINLTTE